MLYLPNIKLENKKLKKNIVYVYQINHFSLKKNEYEKRYFALTLYWSFTNDNS